MKYLWAEWDQLKKRLAPEKEKLILLDFDGTLLPIANSPSEVSLSAETRRVLEELGRTPRRNLAIISGRSMKDLRARLKIKNAVYVANHGLEMKGRGISLPAAAKKARNLKNLIQLTAHKFKNVFGSCYDGLWIEDKHYTLSLHYRNIPKDQRACFDEMVNFMREKYKDWPLVWSRGKKVWEIRPGAPWAKREAALYLAKKFPRALPVAVGDDRADEGMFHALKGKGITVRVGRMKNSKAEYYLESPYDVRVFLKKLCL